ncbi:OPT oligopeptide transporter protein-domain-containing protein [Achaetomium macrosporum]|uniref:OPT oligopeptide transporter protein-domain-containing protein n=1 Tax=Achaetomium macrosporum TaxID=79813 RepID=A0AAN7CHH0_9PEZI|nr:OPT oligopeptide transporter protein-domain-containing protein [Achaetomium macrosporum]
MPRRKPSTAESSQVAMTPTADDNSSSSTPLLPPSSPSYSPPPPHSPSNRTHPDIQGQSFTARGVLVGLAVGTIICFSNMYFGLQTGWVSTMTMPASLLGFGIFRLLRARLGELPFSPVENVLVQTVAGSMAIMPLGCGFVGVLPAMNYLLTPDEQGPIHLGLGKLVLWSLGLCYFGVVFAVPLRRQVIIREGLKFPSGFSTAVLISVLHGQTRDEGEGGDGSEDGKKGGAPAGFASLAAPPADGQRQQQVQAMSGEGEATRNAESWRRNVRLLLVCFFVSGVFTFATYFLPVLRNIPIFGSVAAGTWLWTLNPSLAYVGQGIIMGPATTIHMLLGAVVGWGILSPLAKSRGWAPGPVGDWENGSKGWIVWVSLAIMLADAVVSLGYLAYRSGRQYLPQLRGPLGFRLLPRRVEAMFARRQHAGYTSISADVNDDGVADHEGNPLLGELEEEKDHDDAPLDQQISDRVVAIGLVLSIVFCVVCIHIVFSNLVPLYASVIAVFIALVLSIMGVRAMGETDLNPVSGISKLAQLFFALIIPQSNKSSVLINLVAGAVSEAGALQAGDMMQDLKTGHLLGAAPKAQFWGQVIGATVGAVASAFIYRLYTAVYQVPGDLFQVPTGYVWIFTARLVTGKGLPPMAKEWAIGSAVLFAVTTALRTRHVGTRWHALIPGGIAVAVGMYNVPSFTLARTAGGLLGWWWRSVKGWQDTPLIVLASGLILGEGFLSIVNLVMQSAGVPHLE